MKLYSIIMAMMLADFTAHAQFITNGGFESGINVNWTHSVASGGSAQFSLNQSAPIPDGAGELRINYSGGSLDPYAVKSSTTVSLANDSIYLLRFWARENMEFQHDTNHPDYDANPDFARLVVTIAGANGVTHEVEYAVRQGATTFHLPFKTFEKQLTIAFQPQTAGREYFIDGVELLDQTNHEGVDVLNTYVWNNKRSATESTWLAGDNDVSIHLPDGRTMWFFNDSFDGEPNDTTTNILKRTGGFIRNAVVIEDASGNLSSWGSNDSHNNGQRAYFETVEEITEGGSQKNFYWVGDAIMEDNNVKVYLVELDETGGLHDTGRSYIAEFSYPQLQYLGTYQQAAFCYRYETMFVESGMIYLYKNAQDGSGTHVARTFQGNLSGHQPWEFWNGSAWVNDPSATVSVLNVAPEGVCKTPE